MDFPNLAKTTSRNRIKFLEKLGMDTFNDWKKISNVNLVLYDLSDRPTTRKTEFFHIVGYLKEAIKHFPEAAGAIAELLSKYLDKQDEIVKKSNDIIENNTFTNDTRSERYLSLSTLREKLREIPDSTDKVMLSLYINEPAQRNIYYNANIVSKKSDIDTERNNIIITPRSIRVYVPKHKTSRQYGPVDFALSKETASLIRRVGFPIYEMDNFKRRLQNLSKKHFGQSIGIDSYRHIWEIDLQSSDEYKNATIAKKKKLHEQIYHSMPTALLYNRI
jgi:hypothetical protein